MKLISQTRLGCAFPDAMAILLAVCVTPVCAQVPPGALVVRSGVSFGGTLWVDSFDSADPAFSTGGRYDPAKFRANGDLRCPSLMNIYVKTVIHGRVWAPSYVTSGFASFVN